MAPLEPTYKKLYEENPAWLNEKTNEAILARYRTDHHLPAHAELDSKLLANLANLKSRLRKAHPRPTTPAQLESLEELIDDCLTQARRIDRVGLEGVIKLLRRARNEVIWKRGS